MANKVEKFLENTGNQIDPIGKALTGNLWRIVYETCQESVALCILFLIPKLIGKLIFKVDYSGFDQCYQDWNALNVNRYACYVIVSSNFLLWIMIFGRLVGKTINSIFK